MGLRTKKDLVADIAKRLGSTAAAGAEALAAVEASIAEALASGDSIRLGELGSFKPVARPAREARNPRTGEAVPVAAATVAKFQMSSSLKGRLNS